MLCQGTVSQNTQYFGAGTRLSVLGELGCFCAGLWCCDQETQYFGPGTRLLVLGKLGPHARCRRAEVAVGAGALAGFSLRAPGLCFSAFGLTFGTSSQLTVLVELFGHNSSEPRGSWLLCTGFPGPVGGQVAGRMSGIWVLAHYIVGV